MLNDSLISVIMSVYNEEKGVSEAIESILNQTYKNFEFIIIDDGSTDKSYEVIKNFAKKDDRIIFMKNKNNLGLTRTLNKAIRRSRGEFIARQDADDVSLPKRFEIQLDFLKKNPNYSFCGCNGFIKQTNEDLLKFFEFNDIVKNLIIKNCFYHSTIIIRKIVFNKFGLYNEKYLYSQDYEFFCRLIYKEKIKAKNLKIKLMIIDQPSLKLLNMKRNKFIIQKKNAIATKLKYFEYSGNKLKILISILKNLFQIFYVFFLGSVYEKIK